MFLPTLSVFRDPIGIKKHASTLFKRDRRRETITPRVWTLRTPDTLESSSDEHPLESLEPPGETLRRDTDQASRTCFNRSAPSCCPGADDDELKEGAALLDEEAPGRASLAGQQKGANVSPLKAPYWSSALRCPHTQRFHLELSVRVGIPSGCSSLLEVSHGECFFLESNVIWLKRLQS